MSKTVVVTSIFGKQQSAVADEFRRRGWTVRGTARNGGEHDFALVCRTDLTGDEPLVEAFRGADVVAFNLVQDHRPGAIERTARAVASAAAEAGVKKVVFNLAGQVDEMSNVSPATDFRAARAAIADGSVPSVVLQPTVYMDNLIEPWCLQDIVRGVFTYPAPEDAPISWVSHRSLAEYVVSAAESDEASGNEYRVGGPEPLTGRETAAILGARLGREVEYRRLPLDLMAAGLNKAMGSPTGDRIVSLYARLDTDPGFMDLGRDGGAVLGVRPESFEDFVARQDWSVTLTE
ncbi:MULTISPECIES: SDR family oxidoreductase [Brucella]|uniref:SDR family oxidoreductase n=1 Tax=Brucella TaxID=234 RepID=UPI0011E04872|nr:NmrA family NAD(P)-binding protein [Brucella anthropi]MCR5944150.1 hypothetical protein [Ochrobactrum sp. XJ1]UVV70993.1 NmrA family NAD(P)-binding protein [Brucella anthropi]